MEVVNVLLQHPSASEEKFQESAPAEQDSAEEKDGSGEEHEDGINAENAIEHEFRLAEDKAIRVRELVRWCVILITQRTQA